MKSPSPELANERDALDALHDAIMNLPGIPERSDVPYLLGYKAGHRDARHGAAELAATLASTAAKADAGEWISVEERLPDLGQSVALINVDRWENTAGDLEMNVRACGYLSDAGPFKYWAIRGERATSVDDFTHWLALPSPTTGTAS